MTLINITKSEVLPEMLRRLVLGLSVLSGADAGLKRIIAELNVLRASPLAVDANKLLDLTEKSKEIVQSYPIKHAGEEVKELPKVLITIKTETEDLLTENKLKTSENILNFASYFEKLAVKG